MSVSVKCCQWLWMALDTTVCVSVNITDLAQIWETTWYCGWMMRLNMNSTAVTEDTVGSMWVRQCLVKCVFFFFFLVCKTIDCLICASKISLYCSYGDISCHVWHYIAVLLNVSEYSAIPHSFYKLKYYKYNQTCEVVRLKCLSLQLLKTFLHMQCNIKWALRI